MKCRYRKREKKRRIRLLPHHPSREHPNYPEISVVWGEDLTIDRPATTGILKRLWNYLDKLAKEAQANPVNHTRTLQAQRAINNNSDSIEDAEIVNMNSES